MKTYKHIAIMTAMVMIIAGSISVSAQTINASYATNQLNSFKWIRTISEQNIRSYSEGLAAFYNGVSWGFVDIYGNARIEPQYKEVRDFKYGLSIVRDSLWGVIDKTGKVVFPFEFDSIEEFSNGIALAKSGDISFYLYSDGKKKGLPRDYSFHSFTEDGLARVSGKAKKGSGVKWGYVDKNGSFIIDDIYDKAGDFKGGYAVVSRKGEVFIINTLGAKYAIKDNVAFEDIQLTNEKGIACVKKDSAYVLLTQSGKNWNLGSERLDTIYPYSEGYALVEQNGILKYINNQGSTFMSLAQYDNAGPFCEGKAWVSSNGRYGYINTDGRLIIDTTLNYASDFRDGYAYIVLDGRKGIIRPSKDDDFYPYLSISEISLRDDNQNGKVETEEGFYLDIKLKNTGKETAKDLNVMLSGKGEQASWFNYETISKDIDNIYPGKEATVSFYGTANLDLVSEDIIINVNAIGDNLISAATSSMTFPAAGINQSKPLLASYWVHTKDHTPVSSSKTNIFEFTVKNDGSDVAKDVQIQLRWPEGTDGESTLLSLGNIQPGETKSAQTSFLIKPDARTSAFSVVATVTDITKKHDDVKYLAFEAEKMNFSVNLIGGSGGSGDYLASQMAALYAMNASAEDRASANNRQEQIEVSELIAGITQIKEFDNNRYALVIGNEDYNSSKAQTLYEPNVDYAERDANAFKEYAKNFFGIPENNIILLQNATYAQMRLNLNKITRIAKNNPGKIEIFVYYAGHGQVDGNTKDSYLIPVDVSTTSPSDGIKLEEFYATLGESNAKRTYVFLDACYSGVGRGIIIQPKETPIKGNLMVMTASSATQRSMPYAEKKHGMFTYFLLKSIKDSQGEITIEKLFNSVKSNVQTNSIWINNMEQTPELICGPSIESGWQNWTL